MRGKRKKKFLGVFRLNDGNVSVDKTERVHTSPLVTAIKTIYNITFILLRLECAIFLECERINYITFFCADISRLQATISISKIFEGCML